MSTRDTVLAAAQRLLTTDPTASMARIATAAGVGRRSSKRWIIHFRMIRRYAYGHGSTRTHRA